MASKVVTNAEKMPANTPHMGQACEFFEAGQMRKGLHFSRGESSFNSNVKQDSFPSLSTL